MNKILSSFLFCVLLLVFSTAYAESFLYKGLSKDIYSNLHNKDAEVLEPSITLLDSVSGLNVEFELDATVSDSYGGTDQTWVNLTASPSGGTSQTDHDFYLGADGTVSTDDPTFNGTAGDSGAYWTTDATDKFTPVTGKPTFLDQLHRSDVGEDEYWIAVAFRYSSGQVGVFRTSASGAAGSPGIWIDIGGNGNMRIIFAGDSIVAVETYDFGSFIVNSENLAIFSVKKSTGSVQYWINSSTRAATDSFSMPTSVNTAALNAEFLFLTTGSRIYSYAMGSTEMTDALAAEIFSIWEARHGRTYDGT